MPPNAPGMSYTVRMAVNYIRHELDDSSNAPNEETVPIPAIQQWPLWTHMHCFLGLDIQETAGSWSLVLVSTTCWKICEINYDKNESLNLVSRRLLSWAVAGSSPFSTNSYHPLFTALNQLLSAQHQRLNSTTESLFWLLRMFVLFFFSCHSHLGSIPPQIFGFQPASWPQTQFLLGTVSRELLSSWSDSAKTACDKTRRGIAWHCW